MPSRLSAIRQPVSELNIEPKPFIRWAGSKKKLIPELLSTAPPQFDKYLEPFAGSAQLLFSLKPQFGCINDLNLELVNTYEVIISHPKVLHSQLSKFEICSEEYYKLRSLSPTKLTKIQRATRFMLLNRFCYNGLYRVNSKGQFNVPYANNNRNGSIPSLDSLLTLRSFLIRYQFSSCDFEEFILRHSTRHSFVYLDPPYLASNTRVFNEYSTDRFCLNDLRRLFLMLNHLDAQNAMFLLSYHPCDEIKEITKKYNVKQVFVQRSINCKRESRHRYFKELLISNY